MSLASRESSPVLVTGCSSGIGKAAALALAQSGRTVYATARRPETLADLASAGCRTLALDVTDEEAMAAAVKEVEREHGAVGVLVNNAGYGEYGPIEQVPLDRVRRQFETNVFGLARLTQLVLPGMRAAGSGRVVNVSSMGGRLVFAGGGYYHASKYAVEAISDALRVEVRPFGIRVVVVEPGLIRTQFAATASDTLSSTRDTSAASAAEAEGAEEAGPYAALERGVREGMAQSYRSRFAAAPPEAVARTITRVVTTDRPRTRYVVTPAAKALVTFRRLAPDAVWDSFVRRQFGLR